MKKRRSALGVAVGGIMTGAALAFIYIGAVFPAWAMALAAVAEQATWLRPALCATPASIPAYKAAADYAAGHGIEDLSLSDEIKLLRLLCLAVEALGADAQSVEHRRYRTECKQRNYNKKKNKKNTPDRLELMKYCRFCKKHTVHKETK